jgi:hypothetical protein
MQKTMFILSIFSVLVIAVTAAFPVQAGKDKDDAYQTGFVRWRAAEAGFAGWTVDFGLAMNSDGALVMDFTSDQTGQDPYPSGEYYGGDYYNGGNFQFGQATSPVVPTSFPFREAIASWNAATPDGTWIEVDIRARFGTHWTKDYVLGIWDDDNSTIQRHSVKLQGDADGYVAVDTLVLTAKKKTADAFQLVVKLFSVDGAATPVLRNISTAYSTTPPKKATYSEGSSENWGTSLNVPECSQMVYPDGGNVWCSPTSTSMVLSYWQQYSGLCEDQVRDTVAGVYDWIYDGYGNWPFNTAYAATQNAYNDPAPLEGYVARFTSLAQAEPWIKADIPVIVSFAWGKGDLTGAAVSSSSGHLAVLVGFDPSGNPIINDPAAASDQDVQRTYLRTEFEPLWLTNSGGTVYLIYPPGLLVPGL